MAARIKPRRKMTLRERAEKYAQGPAFMPGYGDIGSYDGFIAGWHARGRADRVTKAERAVVEAAKALAGVRGAWHRAQCLEALDAAVANLERAKGRK